jgi:PAS domain S-box-containing protein
MRRATPGWFTLMLVDADYIHTRVTRMRGGLLVDLRLDPALSVLPESEIERLCVQNLLGSPEESIFFKDRHSRFILVSEGWIARYGHGCTLAEVIGKTDFDFFSEEHALAALADEQRVLATGEPMLVKAERETFHERPDAWAQSTKMPLRDKRGEIVGTWGTSRNITAQVHAEQALRDSQQELRANDALSSVMFERNPQPIYVYERCTLAIVGVNNAGVAIYGYTREELADDEDQRPRRAGVAGQLLRLAGDPSGSGAESASARPNRAATDTRTARSSTSRSRATRRCSTAEPASSPPSRTSPSEPVPPRTSHGPATRRSRHRT